MNLPDLPLASLLLSAPGFLLCHPAVVPTYLEVLDAVVDAGGEDLVLPAAPRLGDDLDHLLQGAAHAVEHGVFVDPGRLAIRVPEAGLRRRIQTDTSKLGLAFALCGELDIFLHFFSSGSYLLSALVPLQTERTGSAHLGGCEEHHGAFLQHGSRRRHSCFLFLIF